MAENSAPTLDEAVQAAVETETSENKPAVETKTVETVKTEEKPVVETQKPVYDEKTQQAINLFNLLNDETTGPVLLHQLAVKAGILVEKGSETTKTAAKTAIEVVKEGLGPEYEFLADRLAPTIEQLIKNVVDAKMKPMEESVEQQRIKVAQTETDSAFEKFYSNHKDAKALFESPESVKLSKEMPYNGQYPMIDYLDKIYKLLSYDKRETEVVKRVTDKIKHNATEVRVTSTETPESRTIKGSKFPTLNESIAAAFRGEKLIQ